MCLLPVAEVLAREGLGYSIRGQVPIVQHLMLWTTFLGATLASRARRHLALSTATLLSERWDRRVSVAIAAVLVGVTACLAVGSWELVGVDREYSGDVAWGIPVWVVSAIMPVTFAAIAARSLWLAAPRWPGRAIAALGLLAPVALGAVPSVVLAWGVGGALLVGTLLGLPIFAAIGGAAVLLFWLEGTSLAAVPGEAYRLSTAPMLPAIPLFTLAGYLLAEGGSSRRLLRLFSASVGWAPGGLAIVTTVLLAFFTPLTGASGITILAMGGLLLPMLVLAKYPDRTSLGLVTASGSIGVLFPPSLPVILYAYYAELPLKTLFVAGILPGIVLVFGISAWGAYRGWRAGAPRSPFKMRELLAASWEAKWEILLPIALLVSIFGGFTTLVEAAAFTVVYALVLDTVIFRELKLTRDLPRIATESTMIVGGFMIILGVALGLTNYLVIDEIPLHALAWVRETIATPLVFLLALNLFLIVVGALMDIYSAIIVVVPLIRPIAAAYGIDPVHLAILFMTNMQLGYLMPPMGENLFLSAFRFKRSVPQIYRATLPYVVILLVIVLLVTYVPWMSLALVRWAGMSPAG